jgi:hypothetical protein
VTTQRREQFRKELDHVLDNLNDYTLAAIRPGVLRAYAHGQATASQTEAILAQQTGASTLQEMEHLGPTRPA